MTSEIFMDWLTKWDKKLSFFNRRICLFIQIQPIIQGVIENWKGYYRSTLNRRIVTALDADEGKQALEVARSINLLDAIHLATSSPLWKQKRKNGAGFLHQAETTEDALDALHDVPIPGLGCQSPNPNPIRNAF